MATRDDHVMTVSYPDGTTIVEHADGTRITTYYRESQVPVGDSSTEDTGDTGKKDNSCRLTLLFSQYMYVMF